MALPQVYDEVVDFIATRIDPTELAGYHPSEAARERVAELLAREKTDELSADERSELDHYLQLEHLLRLAKARARGRTAGVTRP